MLHTCDGLRPFVRAQVSREEQDIQGESMMQRLQLQYDKEIAFIEEQQRSVARRSTPACPCVALQHAVANAL